MANFVIMERRRPAGETVDTVVIRDDFAFLAVIFPVFWLLWHRLWFAALAALLATVAITLSGELLASDTAVVLAGIAIGIFVGLEGPAMRVARHRRDGYREAGAVQASDVTEAELRWFARRRPMAAPRTALSGTAVGTRPAGEGDMMFGFSGDSGR